MKRLLILSGMVLLLGSCYNDKYDKLYPEPAAVVCDTTVVTFAADIMPILNASCNISGGCHDVAGAATNGYNFTTHAGIAAINPELLINDINGTATTTYRMPKNLPKLPECDIKKMIRWVNQGMPNN